MSEETVRRLVAGIEIMNLDQLRCLWEKRFGAPPSLRSVPILRMVLAWRIQAEAMGGHDDATRRMLARTGSPDPEGRHLGIGACLSRQWRGRRIEVVVEECGFRWEDRLFPSLSAAATAIAGSRWNGPRFFGLRNDR